MRRAFTAPPTSERCTANVVLRDGSGAACMHRRVTGTERCWQHQIVYGCPFCDPRPFLEPLPSGGAVVKLCSKHDCKACTARYKAGLPGLCPACANDRTRADLCRRARGPRSQVVRRRHHSHEAARAALYKKTNRYFWKQTSYKPGQKLDMALEQDRRMAKVWMEIFRQMQALP